MPNLGYTAAESPGWFDALPKNSAQDVMYEGAHCRDAAANHQFPIAAAFWIIWIVSTEKCWNLTQNLMQIYCSTHLVILNAMATQCTCSLNSVYHPHWLAQWSRHCSHMHFPVHPPWLQGYINVTQTILILTVAGLFSGQTFYAHIYTHTHTEWGKSRFTVYPCIIYYCIIHCKPTFASPCICVHTHTHTKPYYMGDQSKYIHFIIPDEKCHLWIHNFPILITWPCGRKDIIIIFNVPGLTEQVALDIDILYHG